MGDKQTFIQHIKKSQLNHVDCIQILEHYELFFDRLEKHALQPQAQEKVCKAKTVWDAYWPLASLTVQANVSITEEEWLSRARTFGKAFVAAYTGEDVTTYIHIFIYHLGFFMEKYQSIEKFANYALEGKHRVTKQILTHSTSGFSQGEVQAAQQQMQVLTREEVHRATQPQQSPLKKHKATWAEKSIQPHDDVMQFVVSPNKI